MSDSKSEDIYQVDVGTHHHGQHQNHQQHPPSSQQQELFPQIEVKAGKYADRVFPLTKDEYEALKQSIKENGLYEAITVNESGDVLDGHHRLRACQELGVKPRFEVKHSDNELEEELYVYEINRVRRQLTTFQKVELALKEKPILVELAKRNMSLGGKSKGSRIQETFHVDEELVKRSGVKKDRFYKAEQVIKTVQENPDGELYAKVLRDAHNEVITPNKAYNIIKFDKAITQKRKEAEAAAQALELPEKVTLLNANSMRQEEISHVVKDNSVDLIVTDPPYLKDRALEFYDRLAKLACTKLKDGGSLVFFYGKYQEPEVHEIFAKYKDQLTYWWSFCVKHESGVGTKMHFKGVRVQWKPMLWFVKGTKRLTTYTVPDFIESEKPDKSKHPWAQSIVEAEYLIKNLTVSEDSIILDPFLGSGAFAIPAIKLGRYFIGVELDKDTFENARNNIILETTKTTEAGAT
jgi:ParB-like chromosome segregation protein Spo0J